MGRGGPANEKEAMFKRMYEIFGEGKWTNAHGKTYDLANFTFVLTGNEGEQLFENLPNEDLRMVQWEKAQTRESVKKLLRASQVPEAFTNRIDNVILMKPLANKIRSKVVNKFLLGLTKQMEQAHNVKISFSEKFEEEMARYFFPIGDGARGTERFVKMEVAAFIGDFIISHYQQIQDSKGCEILVDLEVNVPARPWAVTEKRKPEARLTLKAALKGVEGKTLKLSAEGKVEPTSAPRIILEKNARQTAAHEAGHALVNEHLALPLGPLRFVTVESAGNYGGYASYRDEEFDGIQDLSWVIRTIAVSAAGSEAQQIAGADGRDAGWRSDRENMNQLAYRAVVEFGLIGGLEYLPPTSKKEQSVLSQLDPKTRTRVHHAAKRIVREGILLARRILENSGVKEQTGATVEALIREGSLHAEGFQKQIGKYRISEEEIRRWVAEGVSRVLRRKVADASCAAEIAGE